MTSTDLEVEELYAEAYRPLVGLLTVIGGSPTDAEEVAQDAFVRLLERWSRIRRYDDPAAWVRTVAVRMLISRHRRTLVAAAGLRRLAGQADHADRTDPADSGVASASGDTVDVAAALARLPEPQRAVVVLHHVCDLSVETIADQLRLPTGTVKSRLGRGRAALSTMLPDPQEATHD